MSRSQFARAYLNVWVSSMGDPVIPLAVWEGLADPDAERPEEIVLAVDVSPRSQSASIVAAGAADGRLCVSVLEHGAGTSWVAEKLDALHAQLGGPEIVCDAKAVEPILAEIDHLDPTLAETQDLAAGCALLVDFAHRDKLRHRGEPELLKALDGAAQRPLGDSWAWSRKNSSVDITPIVAASLCCWAWRWDLEEES